MNIQKTLSGTTLMVALEGRLDTTTALKLEEELRGILPLHSLQQLLLSF